MSFSFFSSVSHMGGNVLPRAEFFPGVLLLEFCPLVSVFLVGGVKNSLL